MDILQRISPEGLKIVEKILGGLVSSFEFTFAEQPYYLELTERELRDGIEENAAIRYSVRDYTDTHNEHCSEVIEEFPDARDLHPDELTALLFSYAEKWQTVKE